LLPGIASATPTATFRAVAVPISKFPKTGNIIGAGAAMQLDYTISGTEYDGDPPPLIGINVTLPHGFDIEPSGFTTCPLVTLELREPERCPKGSSAGPLGKVNGFVSFGRQQVEEELLAEPFYGASRGLDLYLSGHIPAIVESTITGAFTSLTGKGSSGPEWEASVPLIETVPGAPDGSFRAITVKLGGARKEGKTPFYYLTLPNTCPLGGFLAKTELIFADLEDLPTRVPGSTVLGIYKMPCPREKEKETKPEPEPEIKKIQFKGGTASPEVLISGKGFGLEPPTPSYPPGPCPERGTGSLFGEALSFSDETLKWSAGNGGADGGGSCIGLLVSKWTKSKVAMRFGSDYRATSEWILNAGDSYTVHLLGATSSGSVLYKGK
jgi:hypothetical protein